MRSFLRRFLAVFLFLPLFPLLVVARACFHDDPADLPDDEPAGVPVSSVPRVRPAVRAVSAPSADGTRSDRDDAAEELAQLAAEIDAFDAETGGAFRRTLLAALDDPNRRVVSAGGYRLPAREGGDQLETLMREFRPEGDPEADWAFVMAAAILASSPPDRAIDNYLEFDRRRGIRSVLFAR